MKRFREKLCLILSVACIGCGREMTTKNSGSETQIDPLNPAAIQLNSTRSKSSDYFVSGEYLSTQEILVNMPSHIDVTKGSVGNGYVTLIFNPDSVTDKKICTYSAGTGNQFVLSDCSATVSVSVKAKSKIRLIANQGDSNSKELVIRAHLESDGADSSITLIAKKFLNYNTTSNGVYAFKGDARVSIPEFVRVKKGNAGNQKAYLYFNHENNVFQFYCLYNGGASSQFPDTPEEIEKGTYYNFYACYDVDSQDIGVQPGEKIIQESFYNIMLKLDGSDTRYDTEAFTDLDLDWL
ncbi:MAG: hypothetical protein JNM93_05470 [Bacteriovoracaceae bacterium]|nr:hypothetical protein [Bacteriovoracaceae bacterium]